jgi:hypothetical protein
MTFFAVCLAVLAGQTKTSFFMIEVVWIEIHYSEISSVMFTMAARTIFTFHFRT